MADEIRNGGSKVRVVRLLGHRDDAAAWQIRDFLKRSVVEFQWIELLTEEDCRRELGLSDIKNVSLPVVEPSRRNAPVRSHFAGCRRPARLCHQAQAAPVRCLNLRCWSRPAWLR